MVYEKKEHLRYIATTNCFVPLPWMKPKAHEEIDYITYNYNATRYQVVKVFTLQINVFGIIKSSDKKFSYNINSAAYDSRLVT